MVLRNVVNARPEEIKLYQVHELVKKLLEENFENVDWVLIMKIIRENKKLHFSCIKELLIKSFQREVSAVKDNTK